MVGNQGKKTCAISKGIANEEQKKHFRKQLGGKDTLKTHTQSEVCAIYSEEFTTEQLEKIIQRMKRNKAPGPDGIKNEAWIYCNWEVIEELTNIINKCWPGCGFPESWRNGAVVPVYKKGDKELPENYRGITLMDSGYKIYAELLKNKLDKSLEDKQLLGDTQFGFRKNKGTPQARFIR